MTSPAVPGMLLCLAAMTLLIVASVSSPIWEKVSFLDVFVGGRTIHFGVFGYTGSEKSVGYSFDPAIVGLPHTALGTSVIHSLTFALILHPIAAGLAALAFLFGLCGSAYSRAGTVAMTLTSTVATLVTIVAWVIDMILWGIARNRIQSAARDGTAPPGTTAQYGNANWITLGALVALILAFCASAVGSCGRYRRSKY